MHGMDPNAATRYQGNVDVLMLMMHLAAIGITPQTGGPLGFTKSLKPIWPIEGADDAGLEAKMDELMGVIKGQAERREESSPQGKAQDGGRYAEALDGSKVTADELAEVQALREQKRDQKAKADRKAEIEEAVKEEIAKMRGSSKAGQIGDGSAGRQYAGRQKNGGLAVKAHPFLDATFEDYQPGEVISGISAFKGYLTDGIDMDVINSGKAKLQELGMLFMGPSPLSMGMTAIPLSIFAEGKATLGTTGATGGYVLPNNLVDSVVKPRTQRALYSQLVRVIPGVAVRGIDQPYRLGAPSRMTYANWGATKDNRNEDYGTYTANLVTFAAIYDVAKQYLRFSAGSAEQDVVDELSRAAALAENYEVIAGPGSGSVGSGDACLGVYTSLNATPAFLGYKAAKTGSASNSTVAGSFAAAIAEIMGILAGRNRETEAVVVDHTTYFTALAQGSDAAGFWADPAGGPVKGFGRNEVGQLTFWGTPILYDTNLGSNAATKIAIAAEWSQFKLYRGMEFRIDSSDTAGDRWDKNLVGFRGEMELGFNAETPVHVGAAQLMTSVIP